MANKPFARTRSKSDPTPEINELKKKYEELMEINHIWKQEYERLRIQYVALNDENKRLGGENNDLKMRVSQLEMQQILLENGKKEIAEAMNTEQGRNGVVFISFSWPTVFVTYS